MIVGIIAAAALAATSGPQFEYGELMVSSSANPPPPSRSADFPAGPHLFGAGTLIYVPDPADYPVNMVLNDNDRSYELELGIRTDGKIHSCRNKYDPSNSRDRNSPAIEPFCRAILRKARYEFSPGFQMDAPVGYITIDVIWSQRKQFSPEIRFVGKGQGAEFSLSYSPPSEEKKEASCYFFSNGLTDAEKKLLCTRLLADKAFTKSRKRFQKSRGHPYGHSVKGWLAAPPESRPDESLVIWHESAPSYRSIYSYGDVTPIGGTYLTPILGSFELVLSKADVPKFAVYLYSHTLSTVAIEVNKDGTAKNCRPAESSISAGLDFEACQLALKRGRFTFATDVASLREPLYLLHEVQWPSPY